MIKQWVESINSNLTFKLQEDGFFIINTMGIYKEKKRVNSKDESIKW